MAERRGPEEESEGGESLAPAGGFGAAVAMALGRRRGTGKPDAELDAFLREQTRLTRLQSEHLHEQRDLQLAHLLARRWKDRLSLALQAIGVLAGAAVVAGLGMTAWAAHQDHSLVIEPFSTPPAFAQQGLTGQVLSSELMDRLSTITDVANGNSIATSSGVKADREQDIKLEIPETGVSIGEIGRLLRDWLGQERKVEGELRQTSDGKLVLVARMNGRAVSAAGAPADLDKLEQQVAEQIFAGADAGNYVIYLLVSGRELEALNLAQRLAQAAPTATDAIPLWATVAHDVDPVRDLQLARLAAQVDPASPFSYFEAVRAEAPLGHDEAAFAAARRLLQLAGAAGATLLQAREGDYMRALARNTILLAQGDYATAAHGRLTSDPQQSLLLAAENEARLHDLAKALRMVGEAAATGAGPNAELARARALIDLQAGDWAAAAVEAEAAMTFDRAAHARDPVPQGIAGFAMVEAARDGPLLAEARAKLGDDASANAAIAQTALDCYACIRERGRMAAMHRDWPGAERWFAEAVRQGPSLPLAYADWGQMLLTKGDVDAAIAKLQIAHEKGPHYADALELWGEALMRKGDYAGAAAKFAEAGKDAPQWEMNRQLWRQALAKAGGHG